MSSRSTNDPAVSEKSTGAGSPGPAATVIRTDDVAEGHQSQPGCRRLPSPRASRRYRVIPSSEIRCRRTVLAGRRAAARAADRLLEREAASREVSLGALQVWQALTERVSGKPANREVTLVFTDLVGFSAWSLSAGDEATLKLLRRVSQVVEPPLLEAGGHIVKRMGDGIMAVFPEPVTAVRAAHAARRCGESR